MDGASIHYRQLVSGAGPQSLLGRFYSVQIPILDLNTVYQFELLDIPLSGSRGILVREDSEILGYLKANTTIKMKFYPLKLLDSSCYLDTRIKSIRRFREGKYARFFLVELAVAESG